MWNRIRTGHGYDAHRFADSLLPDKPLVLGGVTIPHERSLLAHSDGEQGTAEGAPYSQEELNAMLELARKGIKELTAIQKEALDRKSVV